MSDVKLDRAAVLNVLKDMAAYLSEDTREELVDALISETEELGEAQEQVDADEGESVEEKSNKELADEVADRLNSYTENGGFSNEERFEFFTNPICLDDGFWLALTLESFSFLEGFGKDFPVEELRKRCQKHLLEKISRSSTMLPSSRNADETEVAIFLQGRELSPLDHAMLTMWCQQRGFYAGTDVGADSDYDNYSFMSLTRELAVAGYHEWMECKGLDEVLEKWKGDDKKEEPQIIIDDAVDPKPEAEA